MKKKMNFPLFNIESIINKNISQNNKKKKQTKNFQKILQVKTMNEHGYKEIKKKKLNINIHQFSLVVQL